jgi:hypothetical protein
VDTTRDGRATAALLAATLGYTGKALAMLSVAAGDSASTLSEGRRALLGATVAHSRGDAEAVTRLIGPIAPRARRTVNPGSVLAYWMLADAYERRGRLDSAAIWFGALLDITRLANDDFFGSGWGYTHSFAHWRLARIHVGRATARAPASTPRRSSRRSAGRIPSSRGWWRRHGGTQVRDEL